MHAHAQTMAVALLYFFRTVNSEREARFVFQKFWI